MKLLKIEKSRHEQLDMIGRSYCDCGGVIVSRKISPNELADACSVCGKLHCEPYKVERER
jgi:hypothetical protein